MRGSPPVDVGGLARSATVIGLVLVLLVSMVGGVMAFEGVNEGNVKVVKNQGAVTGTVLEPGWHFITTHRPGDGQHPDSPPDVHDEPPERRR